MRGSGSRGTTWEDLGAAAGQKQWAGLRWHPWRQRGGGFQRRWGLEVDAQGFTDGLDARDEGKGGIKHGFLGFRLE